MSNRSLDSIRQLITSVGIEKTPADLSLEEVDLTAAANTQYTSPIFDMSEFIDFLLYFKVEASDASTAGEAKVTVELMSNDELTTLLTLDLLTAIPTTADQSEYVAFGGESSATSSGNGTLATTADILRVIHKIRFTVEVTTQSNGSAALGSLWVKASK